MFAHRLMTSIFIVLLVVGVVLKGAAWLQLFLLVGIVGLGCYEWLALIPLKKSVWRGLYWCGALLLSLAAMLFLVPLDAFARLALVVWGGNIVAVIGFPKSQQWWGKPAILALVGWVVFPLFCASLVQIRSLSTKGTALIMFTIALVWAADVGAYVIGKLWGRRKLIPKVSPGKSWEGALGGLGLTWLVAGVGEGYFQPENVFLWYVAAAVIFVQSIFGDLSISMLKRRCGLKDTGCILPGHGGILDRIDSLLAVMPVAFLWYQCCFSLS